MPGAYEVVPAVHADGRGAFLEWFRADRFHEATGHAFTLAQANASVSAAGTLRGVHFADLPPSQAKWVTCLHGAVLDVVVDIRVGSPTYGKWDAVRLDDAEHRAVYLSEGLGHAFMALEDASVVSYLCSAPYAPGREHGINPLDPRLGDRVADDRQWRAGDHAAALRQGRVGADAGGGRVGRVAADLRRLLRSSWGPCAV